MPDSPRRLLVIDDSEAIHMDFRRIFATQPRKSSSDLDLLEEALFGTSESLGALADTVGFEVDSAFQGQEGVAKVREALRAERPYDIVFLDYRMPPGWNGTETLRHLRAVAPSQQVVLCSAYSDYSWEKLVQDFGQPELLVELRKPFNSHKVRELALTLTQSSHALM
jgi:CheY-like chemotaxis protein